MLRQNFENTSISLQNRLYNYKHKLRQLFDAVYIVRKIASKMSFQKPSKNSLEEKLRRS